MARVGAVPRRRVARARTRIRVVRPFAWPLQDEDDEEEEEEEEYVSAGRISSQFFGRLSPRTGLAPEKTQQACHLPMHGCSYRRPFVRPQGGVHHITPVRNLSGGTGV